MCVYVRKSVRLIDECVCVCVLPVFGCQFHGCPVGGDVVQLVQEQLLSVLLLLLDVLLPVLKVALLSCTQHTQALTQLRQRHLTQ